MAELNHLVHRHDKLRTLNWVNTRGIEMWNLNLNKSLERPESKNRPTSNAFTFYYYIHFPRTCGK